jgi:hypothetical protein
MLWRFDASKIGLRCYGGTQLLTKLPKVGMAICVLALVEAFPDYLQLKMLLPKLFSFGEWLILISETAIVIMLVTAVLFPSVSGLNDDASRIPE